MFSPVKRAKTPQKGRKDHEISNQLSPYHCQRHVDCKRCAAPFGVASGVIGGKAHRPASHRTCRRGGGLHQMRSWRPVGSRGQGSGNDIRASNIDIEMDIPGVRRIGSRAERRAAGAHHPQDLEGGDDAVAGRRVFQDDHVAGLLASQHRAAELHAFEDVLVSHRGPHDPAASGLDGRSAGRRWTGSTRPARRAGHRARGARARGCQDSVPVHDRAGRVDGDEPVGVAVQCQADIRARARRRPRAGEAGSVAPHRTLMLIAVRFHEDRLDPRARRGEDRRAELAPRAVRAIEEDVQPPAVDECAMASRWSR